MTDGRVGEVVRFWQKVNGDEIEVELRLYEAVDASKGMYKPGSLKHIFCNATCL